MDTPKFDRIWMKYPKPPRSVRRNKAFMWAHQSIANSLAEEFKRNKKTDPIPEQYKGFEEVFEKAEFNTLPLKRPWDHAMELKPGSEPAGCKVYPLNLDEQKELDTFLEEWTPSHQTHSTFQIPNGLTFLLCQEKGWKVKTSTGLSKAQRHDHQESISSSPNSRAGEQAERCQILHQAWCTMGIQQCAEGDK